MSLHIENFCMLVNPNHVFIIVEHQARWCVKLSVFSYKQLPVSKTLSYHVSKYKIALICIDKVVAFEGRCIVLRKLHWPDYTSQTQSLRKPTYTFTITTSHNTWSTFLDRLIIPSSDITTSGKLWIVKDSRILTAQVHTSTTLITTVHTPCSTHFHICASFSSHPTSRVL